MRSLTRLKGRDFLSLHPWEAEELAELLQLALRLKAGYLAGQQPLRGRTLAMIFSKPSTRTRVSFDVAMVQLGGHAIDLSAAEMQWSRGEPIADTARSLSRYVDAIMIRTFAHEDVEELARWADVPVINGLTNREHPCQALADLLTILERRGRLEGTRLAFVGDGADNVAHSLLHGAAKFGMHVVVACPRGYEPDPVILEQAQADALRSGGRVEVVHDPEVGVRDADVVYTDVWTSMGHEEERERRLRDFQGFTVDARLLSLARPDALFMHCLPAHRGEEVAEEVLEGPQSVVWDQAENRLHAQKAVLLGLLGEG